jgi:hypothetical protein
MLRGMRFGALIAFAGLLAGCGVALDDGTEAGAGAGGAAGGSKPSGSGGNKAGGASQGGSTSSKAGSNAGGSSSGGQTSGASSGAGSSSGDSYGDARERCVARTNELRASIGLKPIPRLASAESCVDGQAQSDSESGKAHGAFDACFDQVKNWRGVGQNECPGYASVESALGTCLDMMWAEGPGGGHYDNIAGDSTQTACGFYTTPQGKVWMVQDFWTE